MINTEEHNPHIKYRPDIDGLRAIAIFLVIIFHAFPRFLKGGFIGVDIFFVISGYLITGIILKGLSRDNFSLIEFYSRRIKRIFPALIVVLSFCLIAGWCVLFAGEYEVLGEHIAASSIYISNFILQSESGYFDIDVELKPLLHLWSLAVEEQFYLFFPLLLILSHRLRINALGVIIIGFAISFALNVSQITDKPTEVFFYPQSRIWELLIGSAVAYISLQTHLLNARTQHIANFLSLFGLGLILIAWVYLDIKKIFFPSYWALLPTFGAAFLIFAGDKAWFNRNILASKFLVFIGLISYPLYLWHWVLLSFIYISEAEELSVKLKIGVLIISIVLAWLTYFLVEQNVRFKKSKFVSIGLLIALLLAGVFGYIVVINHGYPARFYIKENWQEGEVGNEAYRKKGLIVQQNCIDKYKEILDSDLSTRKLEKYGFCLIQNNLIPPTVLLLGDSHANQLYSGLVTNIYLSKENILNLGRGTCHPYVNLTFQDKKCNKFVNEALKMVIESQTISTIIITSKEFKQKKISNFKKIFGTSKINDDDRYNEIQNSMRNTFTQLINANKKIVFILDIPELNFLPEQCRVRPWRLSGKSVKAPCVISREDVNNDRQKYLDIVKEVLEEFPSITVLDTMPAFCDRDYCWAIKNEKMLYRDSSHLNEIGSNYLGQYIKW
jgi:peptidoglycan/LPS O-acetylase OafA/YrhL